MRIDSNAYGLWFVLRLAALLTPLVHGSQALAAPFAPTAAQCPRAFELSPAERARVRCGRLQVPENYAIPQGRQIEIMVAVVEPPDRRPRDPLVVIHGGPGAGFVQQYRSRLAGTFGERTTIIFDERGVGMSRPALCPRLGDLLFRTLTSGRPLAEQTASMVIANRACHDRLSAQDLDLSQYNSLDATSTADLAIGADDRAAYSRAPVGGAQPRGSRRERFRLKQALRRSALYQGWRATGSISSDRS